MKKKPTYIIATPSGRSIVSIKDDPVKALFKNKTVALKWMKIRQKYFKVKLKVKRITVPNKIYNEIF